MRPVSKGHAAALTWFNATLFLLHGGWTAVVLTMANLSGGLPLYRVNMSLAVVEAASAAGNATGVVPMFAPDGQLRLAWLTAYFFGITAAAHLGSAWLWRASYLRNLAEGRNPFRWAEYALSASAMMVAIAYSSVVWDTTLLLCIGVLTVVTMSFGWLNEVINRPDPGADRWLLPLPDRAQAHLMGFIPFLTAWYITVRSFLDVAAVARPPGFVYFIVGGQAVGFVAFALPQLFQVLSRPSRYLWGEYAYMVLSFVVKSVLGGLLLGFVITNPDFEEALTSAM